MTTCRQDGLPSSQPDCITDPGSENDSLDGFLGRSGNEPNSEWWRQP